MKCESSKLFVGMEVHQKSIDLARPVGDRVEPMTC